MGCSCVASGSRSVEPCAVQPLRAPLRAAETEAALAQGAGAADAAAVADRAAEPSSDLNASADYRRHLARVLVRRALTRMAG